MDKNALKKYAVWARRELIEKVTQKAQQFGIEEDNIQSAQVESINGVLLSNTEKKQREALIEKVNIDGFSQVMEEVAYTWFNRFIALRYMEVNGYLPSHIRIFSDDNNEFKPQILSEALHLELDGIDKNKVLEMKTGNKDEDLFKYLLIVQCNALNSILPGMFQRIADYTELLLPDYLLRDGSVIEQLVNLIPENDWTDQVQIIGWLYQYYNIESNELVYDGNMSKSRIPKNLLPAATTIYTPDWAVRYMVDNSLGKLWNEQGINQVDLKYRIYKEKNSEIVISDPKDIKCIDPCMGSGHILCYLFDVLLSIYEKCGYSSRDAASLIINNNLYGLDVDERPAQLAYFAVVMKARAIDRRLFTKELHPHIFAVAESNDINSEYLNVFSNLSSKQQAEIEKILFIFKDAKEYGSILKNPGIDFGLIHEAVAVLQANHNIFTTSIMDKLLRLIDVAEILFGKYDVVVTNPPYLSSSRFSTKLDGYVKKEYKDEKSDLSMVMYKKALEGLVKDFGYVSFITTTSWMFLSSFEKTRKYIQDNCCIDTLVDFGTELFEGKVGHNPIVAWVTKKSSIDEEMVAVRLADYCYSRRDEKEPQFFNKGNYYSISQSEFKYIDGSPITYWISQSLISDFISGKTLKEIGSPRVGLQTSNNEKFLRYWTECSYSDIKMDCGSVEESLDSNCKWYPHNKGGAYSKWFGNAEYVIDYKHNGAVLRNTDGAATIPNDLVFKKAITYSRLGSGKISFRVQPEGYIFDSAAVSAFVDDEYYYYLLGLLNTNIVSEITTMIAPTMNTQPGDIAKVPILISEPDISKVDGLVKRAIQLVKEDWDSREWSWDFKTNPLVQLNREMGLTDIRKGCELLQIAKKKRIEELRDVEQEINRIFAHIYGVEGEISNDVNDKDLTIQEIDSVTIVKELLSYCIGCITGRYAPERDGILFAGGDPAVLSGCNLVDKDNIIPICDDEYFSDDVVGAIVKVLESIFGKESLESNLNFIAENLGGKGTARETIRAYFCNEKGFYLDHCKLFRKRPIYWVFDAGNNNSFKCIVYLHRYQSDTLARIRTDYVHEQQSRYRTAIEETESRIVAASGSDKVKLDKKLSKLKEQDNELHTYEEKVHHLADQMIQINLDDGIKKNYEVFKDVLAKIK